MLILVVHDVEMMFHTSSSIITRKGCSVKHVSPQQQCIIWFITTTENTAVFTNNKINHTESFKYAVRTIANYIIAFEDRSLFVFAGDHANNFQQKIESLT